jgi:hypothetical protein
MPTMLPKKKAANNAFNPSCGPSVFDMVNLSPATGLMLSLAIQEQSMNQFVILEIPGYGERNLASQTVPPIGTRLTVHKHLTDGGTYLDVEVTGHEWQLHECDQDDNRPYLTARILTRLVDE